MGLPSMTGESMGEADAGDYQKFTFRCAKFEISLRHPSGDILKGKEIYGSGVQERGLNWKCQFGSFKPIDSI